LRLVKISQIEKWVRINGIPPKKWKQTPEISLPLNKWKLNKSIPRKIWHFVPPNKWKKYPQLNKKRPPCINSLLYVITNCTGERVENTVRAERVEIFFNSNSFVFDA
jgi:hypothetical protein